MSVVKEHASEAPANRPAADKQPAGIDIEPHTESPVPDPGHSASELEDNSNVPKLSYIRLFWFFFYNFGLFAWGGPVAQIALIKERLVVQDKWITLARFQRVFAVYQILPGPEAVEICMFFGCLSAGRIGGVVTGIAFMLPGFLLMLLASYLYSLAGFENRYFNASFRALQPIVAAMVRMVSSSTQAGCENWLIHAVDLESHPQDRGTLDRQPQDPQDRSVPDRRSRLYGCQQRSSHQHVSLLPSPPSRRPDSTADNRTNAPTASSPSPSTASSTPSSPNASGSLPASSSSFNTPPTPSTWSSVTSRRPSR